MYEMEFRVDKRVPLRDVIDLCLINISEIEIWIKHTLKILAKVKEVTRMYEMVYCVHNRALFEDFIEQFLIYISNLFKYG